MFGVFFAEIGFVPVQSRNPFPSPLAIWLPPTAPILLPLPIIPQQIQLRRIKRSLMVVSHLPARNPPRILRLHQLALGGRIVRQHLR